MNATIIAMQRDATLFFNPTAPTLVFEQKKRPQTSSMRRRESTGAWQQ
jgi:hypothetical protein